MDSEINSFAPNFFGISMVPQSYWKDYGYSLLAIAGSDGIVSDPELEWLTMDMAKQVNVPEDIIADWEDFDYDDVDLEDVFEAINTSSLLNFNKLLIYDAIRMCSADGEYALEEKEQVMEAARLLNVSPEAVIAIEALVDLEHAASKLRSTIF